MLRTCHSMVVGKDKQESVQIRLGKIAMSGGRHGVQTHSHAKTSPTHQPRVTVV